jgi:type I restriction enzyme S subunit
MSTATTNIDNKPSLRGTKQSHPLFPALRFSEFDGDWDKKKIREVLTIGSGKDYKHLKPGNIPVYGTGGLMAKVDTPIHNGKTVFIGRKGSIDKPFYYDGDFWTVDTLFYTHSFQETEPYFVYGLFQKINWYKHNEASGVPSLSKTTIGSLVVNLPSLPEQQKIASFLSAVDEKIQQLTKKKALLENYKKGVMQKLFSGQLRFKDENGEVYPDWKPRKMSEVLFEHKLNSTGNEVVFSVSVHKGLVNQVEHLGRVFAAKNTDNYNLVQPGDIVYTKSPTGSFPLGIIKQSKIDKNVIVSPLYGIFTPETEGLGYMFNIFFESPINVKNYLASIIQKGAKNTINITNTTFLSKKMKLPVSKEEQNRIGDFLKEIDTKISITKNQITQTQTFKKGLLQQLFV